MSVKKPYVVIKGTDVSNMKFGARSYVMTFYPNRHLFLLYDFTDGTPLPEPVQIYAPFGVHSYLLLQDKRIATFSKHGSLDIWTITDDGNLEKNLTFPVYKNKHYCFEMIESKNGLKLLCNGYQFVAIFDLKSKTFTKYDSKVKNSVLLDQGDRTFLVEISGIKVFLFELGSTKTKIRTVSVECYNLAPGLLTSFIARAGNGTNRFYLVSNPLDWYSHVVIAEMTLIDDEKEGVKLSITNIETNKDLVPFFGFYPPSKYVIHSGKIYDVEKSLFQDKGTPFYWNDHHSYQRMSAILSEHDKFILVQQNHSTNPKMLNYQYLTENKENVTNGIDFAPQRTVLSPIPEFVCNDCVIDVVKDTVRLREYMAFHLPDGIMRIILFYI